MRSKLALAVFATLLASHAAADVPAVSSLGSTTPAETSNVLLGWTFSTSVDVLLTRLGYVDLEADGLVTSHELGIFEYDTQTLVASATLAAGTASTKIGDFRYVDVSGATLTAGTRYIVVGTDDSDPWTTDFHGSPTFAPEILPDGGSFFNYGVNTLQVPTNAFIYQQYLGPTFAYQPVPEPASMAALGLGALGLLRRRRKA